MFFFRSKSIFFSDTCHFYINNKNSKKTILWITNSLGSKKYYLPNALNISINPYGFIELANFFKSYLKYFSLYNVLIKNTVCGLLRGFKGYLVLKGLGFKVNADIGNNVLTMSLGYSHAIKYIIPTSVKITILKKKLRAFKIETISRPLLGEVLSRIKNLKKRSSYKYQGIYAFREVCAHKDVKKKSS